MLASLSAALAVGLASGCANQSAPPGGPEDRRPPIVIGTEPDTFAVMLDLDGSVRFQFDERISENVSDGGLESAVTVSPQTGDVRVSHSRSALTVSLDGGFRPGLLYRVTLLPVVSDLFGNRMRQAFELVFSTGGDAEATATLAGDVWDRLTGRGVNGATVRAVGPDSLVHVARTDGQGVFALRYLPAGDFVLTGFQDMDRDGEVGAREAQGAVPLSVSTGDTVLVDIPVLPPDTTPAIPGRGIALDSVTIFVEFDDFLEPSSSSDEIGVRLTRDGGSAPLVTRLFHERAYELYVDQIADSFARLDSIDAAAQAATAAAAAAAAAAAGLDSLANSSVADSVEAVDAADPADAVDAGPGDSAVVAGPGAGNALGGSADGAALDARPRPARLPNPLGPSTTPGRTRPGHRIVGQLDAPLEPGVEYQLRVTSVVNINGLREGAGDVTLTFEPPAPDTVPAEVDGGPTGVDAPGQLPAADPVRLR